jgi:hypothetical protein
MARKQRLELLVETLGYLKYACTVVFWDRPVTYQYNVRILNFPSTTVQVQYYLVLY